MSLSGPENLLVEALKVLPPNSIYTDAERKVVFKGFRLYSAGKVEDLSWIGSQGVLSVDVTDGGLHSVRVSLKGGVVSRTCSCRTYLASGHCEHTVCALLTLIHLFKPKAFKINTEDRGYRDQLLRRLWKGSPEESMESGEEEGRGSRFAPLRAKRREYLSGVEADRAPVFSVALEGVNGRLKAYVERDGNRIYSLSSKGVLPQELVYLANFSGREDMSLPLSIFLKKWGKDYPLYLHEEGAVHRIGWEENIECTTWTEFDTSKGDVLIRKGCAMAGEPAPATLIGSFAFDAGRTRMCYVKDRHGWELWNMMRDVCLQAAEAFVSGKEAREQALRIPKDVFARFYISFPGGLGEKGIPSTVFKVDGLEGNARISPVRDYRLSITRHGEGEREFLIKPECAATSGSFFSPSKRVLSFLKAVELGRIPVSLRTRKRKPILYDMFFRGQMWTGNRKAFDEELKKTINDRTFGKSKFASLARRLIREAVANSKVEELRLILTEKEWQLVRPDSEKEVLLLSIPYQVFGERVFERLVLDDFLMAISEEEFIAHLHFLNSMANEGGIEVLVDGHPIEAAAWEIEIDATGGTIDWFEIRPEIRCNGKSIEREIWEQAIRAKGVVYRDGAVQVLDRRIMDTLAAIAGLGENGTGKDSGMREIVSMPRLRIIELLSLRKKGIPVRLTPRDEEIMTRLTRFDAIEGKPVPLGLRSELRQYQKEGYYWLSFLYECGFGACLADDMGLGKTIQALALLGAIREGNVAPPKGVNGPSLVVMPPSLVFNWENEIRMFYPDLNLYVYRGRERSTSLKEYDVVLTSYGLVRRDIEKLKDVHFNVIVFDEAQTIKNIFAGTTGAVRQLKGAFKVALTGTPVENHIGEYFSIMDVVLPGLLGEYREFQGQARQDVQAFLPTVTERTRPFVLRRTKERILKELPPKFEYDVYLELTERQKKFYNRTVEEVRTTIDEAYRSKTSSQAKIIALTAIMKLRQICLTPELLVTDQKEISPKIEFLTDKLEELGSEFHSSLVFSQFTSFLDIVEAELRAKEFRIFRLDGSTPVVKRKEIVEGFQNCESPSVFLLSLKAGGQGLNLTRATYVFHLDPWWNPAVENQASDRSHRIGQKNKVIVTRLLMRHTVEEKMMALKQRKLSLYRALMDAPERSAGKAITREDFNFLLGLT